MSSIFPDVTELNNALSSATVAVGVMTISVVFLQYFLEKTRRREKERLRELQHTIAAKIAAAEAESVKDISEKLPNGVSAEELDRKIAAVARNTFASLATNTRETLDFVSELVNGYHRQALSQAKVQFWFSVIAAVVGFVYILVAASRAPDGNPSAVLNVIPGVVIDGVAFLFFRQAEQTRERATALYDRLRQDRQIESAHEMVASIDDIHIRSLVRAQIALHMTGLTPKELDLQAPAKIQHQ